MSILHAMSITFWIIMAAMSTSVFIKLKDRGFQQSEIMTMTILLLSGLNICISLIYLCTISFEAPNRLLINYFIIGSSIFQLLLCHFVIVYIKIKRGIVK